MNVLLGYFTITWRHSLTALLECVDIVVPLGPPTVVSARLEPGSCNYRTFMSITHNINQ